MANNSDYEVITGLSLADGSVNPQVVFLQVDSDKTCYVVLPDGTTLTSTAGIINDTWAGADGIVTLIVPKNINKLYLGDYEDTELIISDFVGTIENDVSVFTFNCKDCVLITDISLQNCINTFGAQNCTTLVSIFAPNATFIDASGCALTAVAIAAQLAATVVNIADLSTVFFDFSGGTNAAYSTWSAQAQADAQTIITAGGTVTYNA